MRFKVACLQMAAKLGDKEYNLKKILSMIDEVAKQEVRLAVLPELALTGFNCGEEFLKLAEPIPGPTTKKIGEKAREYGMYIVVGMPERGELPGILYNAAALIGPSGDIVGVYRKTHLALYLHWEIISEEPEIFRRGNKIPVFNTDLGKIGILICQDGDFPETWRVLALKGAEIVAFSSASPEGFRYMWYNELTAMAYQNGYYIVATNKVGKEIFDFHGKKLEETAFGGSLIVNPLGQIVKRAKEFEEDIIVAEIDTDEVVKARWATKLLRDRRPDLYEVICERD
ncbi:MAG: carbon-nitrogen hydrolase family protein [Nitrososphaerota archaeon]|nr:carbon-nitrogen hydrolase family protein [Candidatus Bathyarchaeota archaeon]